MSACPGMSVWCQIGKAPWEQTSSAWPPRTDMHSDAFLARAYCSRDVATTSVRLAFKLTLKPNVKIIAHGSALRHNPDTTRYVGRQPRLPLIARISSSGIEPIPLAPLRSGLEHMIMNRFILRPGGKVLKKAAEKE